VRAGLEETVPLEPGYVTMTIPDPPERERLRAWRRALDARGLDAAPAETLAAKYRVGVGVIEAVSERGRKAGRARGGGGAFEAALRQHRESNMSAIAARVEHRADWSDIILSDEMLDSIRAFIGRVRHRRQVFEEWGFEDFITSARGLTALFQGQPGTGKTL